MNGIKDFFLNLPPGLVPLLLSAPALSVFQAKLHKWISVQSPKVKLLISVALSTLVVLLPHYIGILNGSAELLGAYTTAVLSVMTMFYQFILKEKPKLDADLTPDVPPVIEPKPLEVQPAPKETASEFGPQQ